MKRVSEKSIGLFVIISIALIAFTIIMLGSISLFSEKKTFVMYFTDSVNGLNKGAQVKFRGVKIGEVKQVSLQVDLNSKEISLPIIIEIDTNNFIVTGDAKAMSGNYKLIKYLISKGLRAKLKSDSLITGILYIELDFHPEATEVYHPNPTHYLQIPSIPSSAEGVTNTVDAAKDTLTALTDFIKSKNLGNALLSFTKTMNAITSRVDSKELSNLVKSANVTFTQAGVAINHVDTRVDPVSVDLQEALIQAKDALRSFTVLSDYLSQHPESIIKGKGGSK
jgi:paraquat-inducible protein B